MSKYNCIIVDDGNGGLRVKFELKTVDLNKSDLTEVMATDYSFQSS